MVLLCWLAFAMSARNSVAAPIIMGTGTEWGHWRGELSINGTYTPRNLYQILQDSQIPTQLEKTYLNDNTNMSHFQDLLNHGVSPVMLEENEIQGIYRSVYPSGNDWDPSHVWNSTIQARAYDYLNNVIAPRIAEMKKLNFNGLNIYYVLNPEFVFIGDCKTSSGYAQFCLDEINMLRAANLPGVVIVRGFLVNYGDFNTYLPTIQNWAVTHAMELSTVDYFGPEFHNQFQVNATVASNMITFLATVKSYTGKLNFIPNSYIYWNTTDYNGNPTGSDAAAASFWNYLHLNRDQLANDAGVVGWCLSATLEARGGSGLVEPQQRPDNFGGYVYPFDLNNTYNQGGIAFANWMRDESSYQIMNANSGLVMAVPKAATYSTNLVQGPPTWATDQQWVLLQLSSNGYFLLVDKRSGLVAGTENDSAADGALIVQKTYANQWNAMWQIIDAGNGYWKIKNRKSGLLLNVVGASTSTGARLEQRTDSGASSQLWIFNYRSVE